MLEVETFPYWVHSFKTVTFNKEKEGGAIPSTWKDGNQGDKTCPWLSTSKSGHFPLFSVASKFAITVTCFMPWNVFVASEKWNSSWGVNSIFADLRTTEEVPSAPIIRSNCCEGSDESPQKLLSEKSKHWSISRLGYFTFTVSNNIRCRENGSISVTESKIFMLILKNDSYHRSDFGEKSFKCLNSLLIINVCTNF